MNISNYQPDDIDMSRKLVYDKNVITLMCIIYYDGDDGTELLFEAPDEEFADAFVTMWNEAIDEDESLQTSVNYKQTCIVLASEEIEQLQLKADGLQELYDETKARNIALAVKLKRAEQQEGSLRQRLGELEADVRCFLDELPYVEDNALSRQLRRHVWNDDDTEQEREMRAGEE